MKEVITQGRGCPRVPLLMILILITASTCLRAQSRLDSITRILRLKLYLDQYDSDDIVIGFNAQASPVYNPNLDVKHFPWSGAAETLASFSTDGIALSQNYLALPKQGTEEIRLDVEAHNNGPITLERTELDPLPGNYNIWLIDTRLKDSINLRTDSIYGFDINKADTTTFGGYRFKVVVTNNATAFQLAGFNAVKNVSGAEFSWMTRNEGNHTRFDVQRSTDGWATFQVIDSLISSSAGAYSAADPKPPRALDDYRLKCTDSAGAVSYSNLVTLRYDEEGASSLPGISVYPNPASDMVTVSMTETGAGLGSDTFSPVPNNTFAGNATGHATATAYIIRVIGIGGQLVQTVTTRSGNWHDNLDNLRPGAYVIEVFNKSGNSLVGRQTLIKM